MDRRPDSSPLVVEVAGVTVTIREATLDDVDAVLDLYGRLSSDDLRRRFFSGFRVHRNFVESWIDRSRQGGTVLLAVEGDGERVIADAGYVPTGADTAELAITVDPDRRGWLGPYLLDVLVEHARLHGFVDLGAEVLTSNCGMLALLRSRGCAFVPSDDLSVVKVLIGTAGHVPSWPAATPHPRVLVEGSSSAWHGARAAVEAGMGVLVCPGPERGRTHPCPILHGDRCPLVDEADAVVVALPRSAHTTEPLLTAHEAGDRSQPLALSPALREFYGDVPGRARFVVDPDAPGDEAVDAVRRALAERDEAEQDDGQPGQRDAT